MTSSVATTETKEKVGISYKVKFHFRTVNTFHDYEISHMW